MFEINENYAKINQLFTEEGQLNDLKNWIRIRKDLYQQMRAQVHHRLGSSVPELERYQLDYDKEFSLKWTPSKPDNLWNEIARSRWILMGDFHAMKQSQKAHLRVLRHIPVRRSQILAVEFFEAAHQKYIDQFMTGALSEKDFLKKVQWTENWGFPWEHYRPLVKYAQKHKIPLVGLNFPKKNLTGRDGAAAKIISQLFDQHPESLIVVIFGDLHLAQNHLPAAVQKLHPKISAPLRIFQNAEGIYFKLLAQELESSVDLVQRGKKNFCLMSVPPWVKWQNYLLYLEEAYDRELDEDDDDDESEIDYTDHVSRYVKIIAEELKVSVPLAELSVYTAKDAAFWSLLEEHYSKLQLKQIESLIADDSSFYLPEVKAAYLARASVNHAASLAMQFVHAHLSGSLTAALKMPDDFLMRIWIEAVSYFGSKMINPKRKANTLLDLKNSLGVQGGDHGKNAMKLALAQKMQEMMVLTGGARKKLPVVSGQGNYFVAAYLLGSMMGERMYFGYRKKLLTVKTVQSFFRKKLEREIFSVVYYDIVEVVESLPAPFVSKKEKL